MNGHMPGGRGFDMHSNSRTIPKYFDVFVSGINYQSNELKREIQRINSRYGECELIKLGAWALLICNFP